MESGRTRFCTACGAPIQPDASFCTTCGATLAAAVAAPTIPAPTISMADLSVERIVSAAAGLSMKTGLLKRVNYTLVMTNRRILFAQTTPEMLKQSTSKAREQAKSDGGGFFKQWKAQIAAKSNFANRYLPMTPNQVLTETPGNWALEIARIDKVKYKVGVAGDDETGRTFDKITIKAAKQKYVFELTSGNTRTTKQALIDAGLI